ncbi:pyridoxal phosphate-dependent decarboxylase family protein [Flavobacterium gyeonganense]|uniref:Pyridoxal phosphate-dependent decarboxylase family protein n=1 Tax=Flavobacterium gyeonganense TaxID=1310418 RepID=A0ABV5HC35_9FLAO|nr:aspartate aminotransferase family protein [Flavobacterium gyeonganense]
MNNTLMNDEAQKKSVLTPDQDYYKDIFHQHANDEYAEAIQLAQNRVSDFLQNNRKPFSGIRPDEMKSKVENVDLDTPLPDYESLLNEADELYVKHATAYHLPEYIAHLNCPVVIPALAAEVLISAINSSQDTYDQSAGGTFIERKLIDWTSKQIGYSENADGIFTAGGSQSNLMGLLLARDYFSLEYQKWNIKLDGLPHDASKFRIFVSDKAHFSNHKNAWILGLGEQAIVHVGVDSRYRMDPKQLEKAIAAEIEKGNIPIAITATAGTTDFGNVDPLTEIAHIANRHNLWLHVDAAYGCGLLLTEKYRYLLNGIELADSVTIDYHKSFFQPISSSAFIVKNKLHLNIIKHHADYLNPKEQDYDALPAQINKSIIQSTRRFDALKLWFTLRYMGKEKLGQYTDTIIETAQQTANYLENDENFELLCHSDMGVLVFRYINGLDPANYCSINQYIKEKLFFSGEVLVASTKVNGNFYLKFTIFNPLTTLNDIKNILNLIKQNGNEYQQLN